MKFLHTMIRVANIEKSLKFYQEIIGLHLTKQKELSDATLYYLADDNNTCEVELTYNHQLPEGGYTHGDYFGHLAFGTDNMDEFSNTLKKHNLEYFREPFILSAVSSKIAFIKDPDGTIIEIIEKK